MSDSTPRLLVAVRDLTIDFRVDEANTLRAANGVSFEIPENSTVALVGESGSGKSVTALSIMGLLPDNASIGRGSRILYGGADLLQLRGRRLQALRGRDISMIFQEPMSSLNPVFTIGFQLVEVLTRHAGLPRKHARARAIELLQEVEIPEPQARIRAYPFELSGGQQQRAMIAMALACGPRLLIADEPTTALDVTVQKQILDLLARLQREHRMSMLFITHDLGIVGEIADRVVVMRAGEVREQGPVAAVYASPQDAYTRALLACRPQIARRPARLPVIEDFLAPREASGNARRAPARAHRRRADRARSARSVEDLLHQGRITPSAADSRCEGRLVQGCPRQDARGSRRIRIGQDNACAHARATPGRDGWASAVRRQGGPDR